MKNADEIAFVIGQEGAHHILGHLEHQKKSAVGGSTLFEVLAATLGGSQQSVGVASNIGAAVGARNYSKTYELEADRLGAQMTLSGGFDPVRVQLISRVSQILATNFWGHTLQTVTASLRYGAAVGR